MLKDKTLHTGYTLKALYRTPIHLRTEWTAEKDHSYSTSVDLVAVVQTKEGKTESEKHFVFWPFCKINADLKLTEFALYCISNSFALVMSLLLQSTKMNLL